MNLESHATPTQESPQQRRANLHRAIDRGLESDELWKELAEVNLALGHDDEAVRCSRRITSPAIRNAMESQLERRGLIRPDEARSTGKANARPRDPREPDAPEDAGAVANLRDHVADAVQFLFMQHMPWLCLLTTLAFPLIVGLGGFLTAGGSPIALAAIAAVPGLCVIAVVGAMGRRILILGEDGIADVPELGAPGALARDALRFLGDALLVVSALLVPSLVALLLGTSMLSALPGLLFGMFVLPMAWGLRQIRGDFAALSPVTLLRGVARGGTSYAVLAVLCWGMFAPAGFAAWAVQGKALWVLIAAVGPLVVLPLFVSSRLLGTWFDAQRIELAVVVGKSRKTPGEESAVKPARPATAVPARHPATPAAPPKAAPRTAAPANRAAPRPTVAAPKKAAPVTARPAAAAAPSPSPSPSPSAAAPAATRKPAVPGRPAAAAEPQLRAIEGRSPRRPAIQDAPDLSAMPGAVVVSGQDRVRQGAAARTK